MRAQRGASGADKLPGPRHEARSGGVRSGMREGGAAQTVDDIACATRTGPPQLVAVIWACMASSLGRPRWCCRVRRQRREHRVLWGKVGIGSGRAGGKTRFSTSCLFPPPLPPLLLHLAPFLPSQNVFLLLSPAPPDPQLVRLSGALSQQVRPLCILEALQRPAVCMLVCFLLLIVRPRAGQSTAREGLTKLIERD